jgi:hypothetical protein
MELWHLEVPTWNELQNPIWHSSVKKTIILLITDMAISSPKFWQNILIRSKDTPSGMGQLQCELWSWDSVRTRGSLAVRFAREMSLMLSVLRYEQARVWMFACSVVEIWAWCMNMHSFTLAGMSVTHFPATRPVYPQQKQTPSHPFEFPQSKSSNFGLEPPLHSHDNHLYGCIAEILLWSQSQLEQKRKVAWLLWNDLK